MSLPESTRASSYPKGIAKREEILDAALEVIAQHGYSKTSLRQIAEATDLTKAGLLYYFGSKENLLTEVLKRRDDRDIAAFTGTSPRIAQIVKHNSEVPGLVQLYSALVQESAEASHPAHAYFAERFELIRHRIALDISDTLGDERENYDVDMLARLVIAASDGLQQQWLYDESVDLGAHFEYLWSILRVLSLRPAERE